MQKYWFGSLLVLVSLSANLEARERDFCKRNGFKEAEHEANLMSPLQVSADGRHFTFRKRGHLRPFFYLADSAWVIFQQIDPEEAKYYLNVRQAQGFTAIQATILSDGVYSPNTDYRSNKKGELPLIDKDPMRPNEKFFERVDEIMRMMEKKGLYVNLLPTVGHNVTATNTGGAGIANFKPYAIFVDDAKTHGNNQNQEVAMQKARWFGNYVGCRYRSFPVVWSLGGDRAPMNKDENGKIIEDFKPIFKAMAEGIREADGGRNLISYFPKGRTSSSLWFDHKPYRILNFHTMDTGHSIIEGSVEAKSAAPISVWLTKQVYDSQPAKPFIDGETAFEDLINGFRLTDKSQPRMNAYDNSVVAYTVSLGGAAGFSYGHYAVYFFYDHFKRPFPANSDIRPPSMDWQAALKSEGAERMTYLKQLIYSRPILKRRPATEMVLEVDGHPGQGGGIDFVQAARATDDSYAFVYVPTGRNISVDTSMFKVKKASAYWYSPRQGCVTASALRFYPTPKNLFRAPSRGNDWVLVIDDPRYQYPPPGKIDSHCE